MDARTDALRFLNARHVERARTRTAETYVARQYVENPVVIWLKNEPELELPVPTVPR